MRRAFTSHLALLLAVNLLVKPLYLFGVELGVQNVVGTEAYGRYATYFAFALLFGVVYDLGLQNYNAVTLSRTPALLRERLPVLLALKLAVSGAYVLLVLAAAYLLGAELAEFRLAGLAALYHAGLSLLNLLRTNLGAQERYAAGSLLSVVDRLALVIVVGGLLAFAPVLARRVLTVEAFLLAQVGAVALGSVLVVAATRLEPGQRWLRWDRAELRGLVRAAVPYALVLALTTAYTRVDVVMVEALHPAGAREAGVYAAAYRFLDAANMVTFLFASLLIPMLAHGLREGQPVAPLLRQAGGYVYAIAVGAAAYATAFAEPLVTALLVEADEAWGPPLRVLMWSSLGTGFTYVYGSYLLVRGELRRLNVLFAAALVANVALNALLIPGLGAVGAAAATTATQLIVAGVEYAWSVARVREGALSVRAMGGFTAGLLGGTYGLTLLGLGWATGLITTAAIALGLAFGTGLWGDPRALVALLRSRGGA